MFYDLTLSYRSRSSRITVYMESKSSSHPAESGVHAGKEDQTGVAVWRLLRNYS